MVEGKGEEGSGAEVGVDEARGRDEGAVEFVFEEGLSAEFDFAVCAGARELRRVGERVFREHEFPDVGRCGVGGCSGGAGVARFEG